MKSIRPMYDAHTGLMSLAVPKGVEASLATDKSPKSKLGAATKAN